MAEMMWILLFYSLIITSTTGELNLTITKAEDVLETQIMSLLKVDRGAKFESICEDTDFKSEKLSRDKVIWGKKREDLKLNRKVRNLKYHNIDNMKSRDDPKLIVLDERKQEGRRRNVQLEQQTKIENEKRRRKIGLQERDRQAKEASTIFVLIAILITLGIVICIICKRATRKFERNSHEIQNFIVSQLSDGTSSVSDEVVNGQIQISNAGRCSASNDDDDENYVLSHARFYTTSILNNVQNAHLNNIESYDLPPTYEEAVADIMPRT